MLNLSVFSQNHHLSWVNLMEKYSRRGIWVQLNYRLVNLLEESLLQGCLQDHSRPQAVSRIVNFFYH